VKALRTLLKLAERDLEVLRRALGDQLGKLRSVDERLLGHEQTLRAEQALAMRDYESARAFGGYAVLAKAMHLALEAEQAAVAQEIERLRGLVSEAHVEVRKFERLIELEEAREKAAREKREAAELDEFATLRNSNRN
jgi:flagellar protein FliJ